MAFKFRLETPLHLAEQEMKILQGVLAQEMRVLQSLTEQKEAQECLLEQALSGQKAACLEDPGGLGMWQKYSAEQREILLNLDKEVKKQQRIVEESKEKLLQCRIKVEKYKRLKEKKLKLYNLEELKKEQKTIDEIAQTRTGGG